MKARGKFLVGSGIIVATLLSLAYVGYTQSKTYYHTISELPTLQAAALHQRMRVSGNVRAGSIAHRDGRVDFVLEEQGKSLAGQLCRPRSASRHLQGRRASARRRAPDAGRQFHSRTGAGEVRIQVPGQPTGAPAAAPARRERHRSSEQELTGGIRGYFRFVCAAARVSGSSVCVRRRDRGNRHAPHRCSPKVRAMPGWLSSA